MTIQSHLNKAVAKALQSDHNQFKHATLIFKSGRLLASACNLGKRHAEARAISKVKNKDLLVGATMVNVRVNRENDLAMSKPCENCKTLIREHKIKIVYYTTEEGNMKGIMNFYD